MLIIWEDNKIDKPLAKVIRKHEDANHMSIELGGIITDSTDIKDTKGIYEKLNANAYGKLSKQISWKHKLTAYKKKKKQNTPDN